MPCLVIARGRGISAEAWGSYSRHFDTLRYMPGVVTWWHQAKPVFEPRFAQYFEAKLLAERDATHTEA